MTKSRQSYLHTRDCLRVDFGQRCTYCMCHDGRIGIAHFQIDHFMPTSEGGTSEYENLFWSCGGCNNSKRAHWPSAEEQRNGMRFANPCAEIDYGVHLIEKPDGELAWLTPCGEYHCEHLLLNRSDLVKWRQERTERRKKVRVAKRLLKTHRNAGKDPEVLALCELQIERLQKQLERLIPVIPRRARKAGRPA